MAEQEILNVRLGEGDRSVVLLDQSQLPNRVRSEEHTSELQSR